MDKPPLGDVPEYPTATLTLQTVTARVGSSVVEIRMQDHAYPSDPIARLVAATADVDTSRRIELVDRVLPESDDDRRFYARLEGGGVHMWIYAGRKDGDDTARIYEAAAFMAAAHEAHRLAVTAADETLVRAMRELEADHPNPEPRRL